MFQYGILIKFRPQTSMLPCKARRWRIFDFNITQSGESAKKAHENECLLNRLSNFFEPISKYYIFKAKILIKYVFKLIYKIRIIDGNTFFFQNFRIRNKYGRVFARVFTQEYFLYINVFELDLFLDKTNIHICKK